MYIFNQYIELVSTLYIGLIFLLMYTCLINNSVMFCSDNYKSHATIQIHVNILSSVNQAQGSGTQACQRCPSLRHNHPGPCCTTSDSLWMRYIGGCLLLPHDMSHPVHAWPSSLRSALERGPNTPVVSILLNLYCVAMNPLSLMT